MDSKTLIKALKIAVRDVIKEELTEILREGLQSTIIEMTQHEKQAKVDTNKVIQVQPKMISETSKRSKVQFTDNKWANVLNETDVLTEDQPLLLNNFRDIMNEGVEEIRMSSQDAVNFGAMRQNLKQSMGIAPAAPKIMDDPETGKTYEVPQEIQQVMTRDYSALMKAIDKKKGK